VGWLGRKSESGKFKSFESGADRVSYGGLVATRFMLGLFEAGCLPLFVIKLALLRTEAS
jgi:hypothetical protein